jgi:hypothetical protein
MPRPKDIVTLRTTAEQRRDAVIRRAIEVHNPYRIFKQQRADGFDRKGYCLIHVNPFNHSRHLVMQDIEDRETARDLRELLENAWVLGYLEGSPSMFEELNG